MEKRILLAVVLSMIILFFYPYMLKWINPEMHKQQQQEEAVKNGKTVVDENAAPVVAAGVTRPVAAASAAETMKEDLINVQTPLYRASFSTIGGGIRKWEITKYKKTGARDSSAINLSENVVFGNSYKTLVTTGGTLQNVALKASKNNINLTGAEKDELILTGATAEGLMIEKKYVFNAAAYAVDTELKFTNASKKPYTGSARIALAAVAEEQKDKATYHVGPLLLDSKGKLVRITAKEAQKAGSESFKWLGLEDKYFLSVFIAKTKAPVGWLLEAPTANNSRVSIDLPLSLNPGEKSVYAYSSFVGPKEYDLLTGQKLDLEESIEFGMFAIMAKPFLIVLNFFEKYLGNYGIAIILLTVITKVVFYPLTKHSMNSMKEMQRIQPQLVAIKEKFKNDKEKLNKEMMELYKRYKINPIGGCLPMVLQIPVFLALYEVLYVAIELRQAPFFLWIHDLSDKDPYYITPLIMGATMFVQQKMTPTTMDPTQAKIMLVMPVVFTFMFLNFPSGLVIYWLVNNALSIAQQYYIQKTPSKAAA